MTPEQFSELIAALRVKHSVREIALAFGVDRGTLYRWRQTPPSDISDRVVRATDRLYAHQYLTNASFYLPIKDVRELLYLCAELAHRNSLRFNHDSGITPTKSAALYLQRAYKFTKP